ARGPVALQTLLLGALFILATFIVFGALAWLAGSLGTRMQGTKKTRQWLNRLAGVVFIGLAVRLALADR
ncbi:MAG: LysE family transporter, partial [Burkholderiaceae bacterium]